MSIEENLEYGTNGLPNMESLVRFAASLVDTLATTRDSVRREGELLQTGITSGQAITSASLLLKRADTLDQLVRELSRFSSLNAVKPQTLNLTTFLETQSELMAKLASPYSLCIQCSRGLPSIVADPFELETVLFGLVSIPRKRMSSGGSIIINVRTSQSCSFPRNSPHVMLEFNYIGLKLAHDELARLFEPRLIHNRYGLGLGLCTVYGAVRRMNGDFLTSQQPNGLRFVIQLPVATTRPG